MNERVEFRMARCDRYFLGGMTLMVCGTLGLVSVLVSWAVGGTTFNGLPDDVFASTSQLIIDLVYEHFNDDPDNDITRVEGQVFRLSDGSYRFDVENISADVVRYEPTTCSNEDATVTSYTFWVGGCSVVVTQ